MPTDIPSSVYKNAIDLNRYSNSVAKRLVISYNRIILNATKELQAINPAGYRAGELRTIMGSLKTSLDGWATEATKSMKTEVTGLAESQVEFAVLEIMNRVKADIGNIIKDPLVSPQFAEAVVSIDPTELNMVALSDDLQQKVGGRRGATFQLGAREGALVTLPNGESLEKSFRGLSIRSAEKFRLEVQDGLLTGEPIDRIVRNLIGRQGGLVFSTKAKSAAQIANAGGGLTRLANHQIMTLVRTSVNQVSNVATQQTYKANRNITDNFMFVATLDSRTSLVCAANDGKEFSYDDGPVPPLHFNCRSTTVAVPNWKKLKEVYGIERPDEPAMRASPDGLIPAKEKYGDWLYKQRVTDDKGRTIGPGIAQIEALGRSRAIYFNRLAARKGGPDAAIRKLIREDGSEKTLEDIRKQYKLRAITLKKLEQLKLTVPKDINADSIARTTTGSPGVEARLQKLITYREKGIKGMVDFSWNQIEELGGETGVNAKKMRKFMTKHNIFNNFAMEGERWKDSNTAWYYKADLKKSMDSAVKDLEKYGEYNRTYVGKEKKWFLKKAARIKDNNGRNETLKLLLRPPSGRATGYTFMTSNIINTQLKGVSTRITASRAKSIKKIAAEVLAKTAKGKRDRVVALPKVIDWTTGTMVSDAEKWIVTMIHEIGHQVHAKGSGGVALGNRWKGLGGVVNVTGYSYKNPLEQFAEGFVQYVLNPEGLKKEAPRVYNWVEETLEEALK